jgi:Fe-S cluster assembly protein SufD
LVQTKIVVLLEDNASITLIESFYSLTPSPSLFNSATEVYLNQNSLLDHYILQLKLGISSHICHTSIFHEAKSNASTSVITQSGELVRNNLLINLNAPYSECTLNGLYIGNAANHIDNHTTVYHAVPNCLSDELYKGIINHQATAAFNGKIIVKPNAQKTNAFQSNKNILLSKDAIVNAKPQLEIYANDVKCSHGATTGKLDDEALFYLRARGISHAQARTLLVKAFANEIIDKIKIDSLKTYLLNELENIPF